MALFKKDEEYIPQFEVEDTNLETPSYCKICRKLDDTIDESGICYNCRKLLERQNEIKNPNTKYEELLFNHNSKFHSEKTNNNKSVKRISDFCLKLKIGMLMLPILIFIVIVLIGIFLEKIVFTVFATVTGVWVICSLPRLFRIFKNIKMLKRMELYELSKSLSLKGNKVILDERKFVITEKFIYSNKPWRILPIEYIESITIKRGYKSNINVLYLTATMNSGERFCFYTVSIVRKEEVKRYIREISRVNPFIEINILNF